MKTSIYNISAKSNFFKELALGIINKNSLMCKLKNNIIILPTKLACLTLKETFKELNMPCPIIQAIGDLSFAAKNKLNNNDVPNKIAIINKISKLILTMNISGFTNILAATELAEYFANLINKLDLYQIDIAELQHIIIEDLDLHKQQISSILNAFMQLWENNSTITKAKYSNLLIEEFIKNIADKNVIIAGINSNIPVINKLLKKAYHLPNCYIILYGIDDNLNKDDWNNIEKNHPQYNFKYLFQQLNIDHLNIINWHNDAKKYSSFISHAFRPAKLCYNWNNLESLESNSIKYLSLADQHEEAKAILKIIKTYINKSIMIVTNDEALTVKLTQHLNLANIDVNIVRDYPLSNSKTAIWLKLCLNFILEKYSILSALSLLKHSFSSVSSLEIETLVRNKNFFGNNIFDTKADILNHLFSHAENITRYTNFKEFLTQHIYFAENISNQNIWENTDGEELKLYLDQLHQFSENNPPISIQEYSTLFNHFIKSAYYRKENVAKNITLIKSVDSRLHSADIVILAGLNQDIWPTKTIIDPCFNSFSLEKIGLPSVKQQISEETYDFCCLMQAEKVFLTRAEKINGNITLESPWISRLCLLSKNSIIIKKDLNQNNIQINEKKKEFPSPPIEYRPKQLSVTQVEKLIFNPYHIYVDLILKLSPTLPINRSISSLDFGNFIHKSLYLYHQNKNETLINAGIKALNQLSLNLDSVKILWWPRFLRIAKWFTLNENSKAKIFLENFGSMKICDNFTIIAIADRLEFLSDNSLNIIDYKTGKLASAKSIYNGKTLQLLLEALIALENGFTCQKTKFNKINSLTYIQLSGGEEPAEILEINIEENELIVKTKKYIEELIKQYQDPNTPYHYSKKKTIGYCKYEHLFRY